MLTIVYSGTLEKVLANNCPFWLAADPFMEINKLKALAAHLAIYLDV